MEGRGKWTLGDDGEKQVGCRRNLVGEVKGKEWGEERCDGEEGDVMNA